MSKRPVLILFVVALLFAIVYGFTQGFPLRQSEENIPPTPNPTLVSSPTSLPSPTDGEEQKMQQVYVYLIAQEDNGKSGERVGCGDSLVPVFREILATEAVLRESLTSLFALEDQYYGQSGLYNALYNSDLQVDSAEVRDGTATVNLSGQLSLGGVCDNPRVEGQIRKTAEQFDTVNEVEIFLNGEPLSDVLSGQ